MKPEKVVIVGAGQAGLQTAESLRALGFEGLITLLGDERYGPYHRPPLSKAWLAGEATGEQLSMRSPDALARKSIELRTGVEVSSINIKNRALRLVDGSELKYDALVLATGAKPRSLDVPGANSTGVLSLRSLDDAKAIAQRMAYCAERNLPVVIVGGGFIGLEVAATARKKGVEVIVLEAAPRLLGRVLAPFVSEWFAQLHQSRGVKLVLNARVGGIDTDANKQVCAVRLQDGTALQAGMVIVGIGVQANDGLARSSGLSCDQGIIVDECSRTSDPHVFAAGDCTARRGGSGTLMRLESVQNATEQGRCAAAAVMGKESPFKAVPWFWSDQYEFKLQIAGLSAGANRWEIHGEPESGSFNVYHYLDDRLLAVDSVNATREHLLIRKRLEEEGKQALFTYAS